MRLPFLVVSVLLLAACEVDDRSIANGTCVEPGEVFADHYDCSDVRGPKGGNASIDSSAVVGPSDELTADPDLEWTREQALACSCTCCHGPGGVSRYVWDVGFEPAWTDSANDDRLGGLLNRDDDPAHADTPAPADNFGFDRIEGAGIPTQDAARFTAFIDRELARRAAR